MLRSLLTYLSKTAWAQNVVTNWGFAWRVASRFLAGTSLNEALRVTQELNARGIHVTLDHLGEHTTRPEEASEATEAILNILDELQSAAARANLSIKLTQIGLGLDEGLCARNLERILARARQCSNFIRIDMEDSPYTDKTLHLYREMRKRGYENVGVVLQSYLYRSEADARQLIKEQARIRLVKGAYKEPRARAFPRKADVDANYDLLAKMLIDAAVAGGAPRLSPDGRFPPLPAIATHDE